MQVQIPYSKFKEDIIKIIHNEGYIKSYAKVLDEKGKPKLQVDLKYSREGDPVIHEIKRVSTPGKRIYRQVDQLKGYYNNLGVVIMSTPQGVMTDFTAKKQNLGGEVVCQIF
jgi:small subunit ribosomal protein S8